MKDLRLTEIWIYPIKSLGGIPLKSAKVMEKGLQHDRRFMLVGEDGLFMTQRIYPKMALFKPSIDKDQLTVKFQHEQISIPAQPTTILPGKSVHIWDDAVSAQEIDSTYNQWFSDHLGINCRLVYFPEENPRPV